MPTKLVALIRGINVGKAKRVAMADLRALVEKLGYGDVRTLLNSGNVVFTSANADARDAARRIEDGMSAKLGVSARVTVLTAAELAAAVKSNPLLEVADNPSRLMMAVLLDPADRRKLEPLLKQDWSPEALALGKRRFSAMESLRPTSCTRKCSAGFFLVAIFLAWSSLQSVGLDEAGIL